MSLSLEQKTRLLARQVQRFHEYSAGTGRPNSKIIKAPDVKLAAALEPDFGFYASGDAKATHESWPFYWQLHGKGRVLTRDLEWFRHMGYKLLQNGKVEASDLPTTTYEEQPKQNWDELYGPPAPALTEAQREAMWAETGADDKLHRLHEKSKPQPTAFERIAQDSGKSARGTAQPGDGDLISLATDSVPVNKALCDFEPLCLQ